MVCMHVGALALLEIAQVRDLKESQNLRWRQQRMKRSPKYRARVQDITTLCALNALTQRYRQQREKR